MTSALIEEKATMFPRQRFWKACYAALVTVLYIKGIEAMITPDGLTAAIWLEPLTVLLLTLPAALALAPVALLNTAVFAKPFVKMRAAHWRQFGIWALWISYTAIILYAAYRVTASSGLRGQLLGMLGLIALTALNYCFQHSPHPHRLLFTLTAAATVAPMFLYLRPVTPIEPGAPIIWVTKHFNSGSYTPPPVYWQPDQSVFLQWKGRNYRLEGMSPAFAIRERDVLTLEGRDLVVTPMRGTPRRISLKEEIPNYEYILNMQPTRDGVMFNVYSSKNRVVRVNLDTDTVQQVPHAWRVRGAEATNRYVVKNELPRHQVRERHDRVLRQHGLYPWHFGQWDADPVDDLFAITSQSAVTLIGPNSISMITIDTDMAIGSITMQPGRHQVWIAETVLDRYGADPPSCRVQVYSYNGHRLGERTIIGAEVLRVMPIEESMARYLIEKYSGEGL